MLKKHELSPDNSSNSNQITPSKKEIQTQNVNKTNKNIINKIHSIKASINNSNNSNKFHLIRRKNNFKRERDISSKKNKSRSKSKNKEISNSLNKILIKNKIINDDKSKNNKDNFNTNINLNQNCSLNENLEKNNFFMKNSSNSNMNNNNIIITINNYNKITPTKIVDTININGKNSEIKNLNQKKVKKTNKKEIQNLKKTNEKNSYNCYINGHYNLNRGNDTYNNNIFYNQLIFNKNENNIITNTIDDNNIDSLSINTNNTINRSHNIINSNNNSINREYNNKILVKKNNKYQDNIILKKKQLEMYSPLSFLKKNLEIDKRTLNEIKFKEKINAEDLSSINNTNINSKFNSTSELGLSDKKEKNENKTKEKIETNDNDNTNKDLSDIIMDKIEQNIKNKNQVSNILSTLNRIKNTKQLYKNKKVYGFTKITKKKRKPSLNNNRNNNSYSKTRPFKFFDKREYSFNDRLYYSRSNSKNALSHNFNIKYKNLNKNRTSKSNQKLIDRSFMSENRDYRSNKTKINNDLFLSNRHYKDKLNTLNNLNSSKNKNIKENRQNKMKLKTENNESKTLNNSINDIKNSPVLLAIKKPLINEIKNNLSISTNIDTSINKNNNKIIDTYESATIANIDKHCDSLLSKINKKIRIKDEIKSIKIYKKIIANASLCRKGSNRPEEESKINQDTLFKVKFADLNYSYYGVCDGHGPLGHLVSDFIKSNITFIVYKYLKSLLLQKANINNNNSNDKIDLKSIDDSFIDFAKLFKDSFLLMQSKLSENKSIDIELSGTTCVSLLFCSDRIISSNVGDSRAIKGFYSLETKKWEYIPLSRDHKPSEKDEAERIKNSKGIIHPYIDDDKKFVGPDRVWNESEELPGLAMSRSFGDGLAKLVGVYSEPEVKIFPYKEEDKFIIIASDGLWEYVSNEEVVEIVGKYHEKNDCDGAVSELYEISKERWVKYDDYIDDISIIVVFLGNTD